MNQNRTIAILGDEDQGSPTGPKPNNALQGLRGPMMRARKKKDQEALGRRSTISSLKHWVRMSISP